MFSVNIFAESWCDNKVSAQVKKELKFVEEKNANEKKNTNQFQEQREETNIRITIVINNLYIFRQ